MTQKELLYLEDAIGHETNIISIINESIKMVKDSNLRSFFKKELKKHNSIRKKLISKMEDKENE